MKIAVLIPVLLLGSVLVLRGSDHGVKSPTESWLYMGCERAKADVVLTYTYSAPPFVDKSVQTAYFRRINSHSEPLILTSSGSFSFSGCGAVKGAAITGGSGIIFVSFPSSVGVDVSINVNWQERARTQTRKAKFTIPYAGKTEETKDGISIIAYFDSIKPPARAIVGRQDAP